MTYDKLPGVYFKETVGTISNYGEEKIPLFIIQTSTAIAALDGQVTRFTTLTAFNQAVQGKGLTKTYKYIEQAILEYGNTEFYVYSIKTDTKTAFIDAIKSTAHLTEVTDVIYVEETASAQSNTIANKISALELGLGNNAENGVFREGYVIPYGTINAAITEAENVLPATTVVAQLTTILAGDGNGRVCVIVPDTLAGTVAGHILRTRYDQEPGFTQLENVDLSGVFNFDYNQMVTLQNLGVLFVRKEKIRGIEQYRINLGVTTSFKTDSADGLLVSRRTADELLRQISWTCQAFVKAKESASNLAALNCEIGNIIEDFAEEESITKAGTILTASDAGNYTFEVTGTILPIKSVIAIEVDTTITDGLDVVDEEVIPIDDGE